MYYYMNLMLKPFTPLPQAPPPPPPGLFSLILSFQNWIIQSVYKSVVNSELSFCT